MSAITRDLHYILLVCFAAVIAAEGFAVTNGTTAAIVPTFYLLCHDIDLLAISPVRTR